MRRLTSSPALVTASVLTLALAIGINAAMVGLVYRAFLSAPSLVANPDRLELLAFEQARGDDRVRMTTTSWVTFAAIRDQVTAFSGVAAWQRMSQGVVVNGEQTRADVMLVSGGYFGVLGTPTRLGRAILENDDRVASEPVAVLSHRFWRSTFGSDPRVLGQRVSVNGIAYAIVGVMPGVADAGARRHLLRRDRGGNWRAVPAVASVRHATSRSTRARIGCRLHACRRCRGDVDACAKSVAGRSRDAVTCG